MRNSLDCWWVPTTIMNGELKLIKKLTVQWDWSGAGPKSQSRLIILHIEFYPSEFRFKIQFQDWRSKIPIVLMWIIPISSRSYNKSIYFSTRFQVRSWMLKLPNDPNSWSYYNSINYFEHLQNMYECLRSTPLTRKKIDPVNKKARFFLLY